MMARCGCGQHCSSSIRSIFLFLWRLLLLIVVCTIEFNGVWNAIQIYCDRRCLLAAVVRRRQNIAAEYGLGENSHNVFKVTFPLEVRRHFDREHKRLSECRLTSSGNSPWTHLFDVIPGTVIVSNFLWLLPCSLNSVVRVHWTTRIPGIQEQYDVTVTMNTTATHPTQMFWYRGSTTSGVVTDVRAHWGHVVDVTVYDALVIYWWVNGELACRMKRDR